MSVQIFLQKKNEGKLNRIKTPIFLLLRKQCSRLLLLGLALCFLPMFWAGMPRGTCQAQVADSRARRIPADPRAGGIVLSTCTTGSPSPSKSALRKQGAARPSSCTSPARRSEQSLALAREKHGGEALAFLPKLNRRLETDSTIRTWHQISRK